jgi:toxin FitB
LNYLLDTNIISALAPTKVGRPAALLRWLEEASPGLYLSVVTAAEVKAGIAKAMRDQALRKAEALTVWWEMVEQLYGDRILSFDLSAAAIAGELMDASRSASLAPGFADIAIAATAQANGLAILTQNTRHFAPLRVLTFNPFDGLPPPPGADRQP